MNFSKSLQSLMLQAGWIPLVAVLVLSAPAAAMTYYASPSGSASNSGTQVSPWSLDKANTTMISGDVCILLPGTYSASINPSNSGTGPTSRIRYIGSITSPATTVVTSVSIKKAYIVVKGVKANADIALDYPARNDSVAWCISAGGHFFGAKNSMIARNAINGTFSFLLDLAQTTSGTSNCEYDTLRGNIINLGAIPATHGFKIRGYTQNCLIDSNRVSGTFTQTGANDGGGRMFYNSSNNTLRDNFWQFTATNAYNANNDPWNGFVLRDSTRNYTFVRDTMILGTTGGVPVRGVLCSSGSFPGSVANNTWQDCVFKVNSSMWVQNGLRSSTLRGCVIAGSSGGALWFSSPMENSTIDHCTIYSTQQAMKFDEAFIGTNRITNNVIYSASAGPIGNYGAQTQYASNATSNVTQNYNLFFTPSFTSSPGDRSLMWCCYTGSKPGAGTPWASLNGQDISSRYGSPQFVDSTFAGLDAHLRLGSIAIGRGEGGTDVGALPFGTVQVDVTPPAVVADLDTSLVGQDNLTLRWTAPGDDALLGTALLYEVRYSKSAITSANFSSATMATGAPAPVPGGTPQVFMLSGLQASTLYWVALKARDDAGNWSPMSNVVAFTTRASDVTAPGEVKDLSAGP